MSVQVLFWLPRSRIGRLATPTVSIAERCVDATERNERVWIRAAWILATSRQLPIMAAMSASLSLSVPPIVWAAVIKATERPAAMMPYSIGVAPDSSLRNDNTFDIFAPLWLKTTPQWERPVKARFDDEREISKNPDRFTTTEFRQKQNRYRVTTSRITTGIISRERAKKGVVIRQPNFVLRHEREYPLTLSVKRALCLRRIRHPPGDRRRSTRPSQAAHASYTCRGSACPLPAA